MGRTKSFYDLRDALQLEGCPVCRLKAAFVDQALEGLIYENVNDPVLRARIRAARGFCHEHAWGLLRHGAALGSAIIMRDVLREVLRTVDDGRFKALPTMSLSRLQEALTPQQPRSATAELVARLGPQETCPMCVSAGDLEEGCLAALRENLLGDDGLLALYSRSDGLCLPHFRQALSRIGDEAVFTALVGAQQGIWRRLEDQLSESIRKSDYRFSEEELGKEAGSWLRGIAAIAGSRVRIGRM